MLQCYVVWFGLVVHYLWPVIVMTILCIFAQCFCIYLIWCICALKDSEWWLIHLAKDQAVSAIICTGRIASLYSYSNIHIFAPKATNINLTLICPLELHRPSPDTHYWLLIRHKHRINAARSAAGCSLNSFEDHNYWGFFSHYGSQDETYWFGRPRFGATLSFLNVNDPGGLNNWSSAPCGWFTAGREWLQKLGNTRWNKQHLTL